MSNRLSRSADALEEASKQLQQLRELQAQAVSEYESCTASVLLRNTSSATIAVLSHVIESVGLLGEEVALMQTALQAAGNALTGELTATSHQCPECGLPLGSNASDMTTRTASGCNTCTLMIELHRRVQGNRCPDCGCLIGTNGTNCRRCLDEAYFQRIEQQQRGSDDCRQCGNRLGTSASCSACEAYRA